MLLLLLIEIQCLRTQSKSQSGGAEQGRQVWGYTAGRGDSEGLSPHNLVQSRVCVEPSPDQVLEPGWGEDSNHGGEGIEACKER